ncbi:hypothetical protein JHK82_014086 [Glycine max]|nr:hypothetical protein JHK82_014086 [Glycine max]
MVPFVFVLNKTLPSSNLSRGCSTCVSLNQQTLFFLFPHSLCLSLSINAIPFVENLEISTSKSTLSINDADQSNKAHRTCQSGAKTNKKKTKKKQKQNPDDVGGEDPRKQNPKAFAFSSSNKAKLLQSRAVEKKQCHLHAPVIDRSYDELAPYVVIVLGSHC